MQPFAAIFILAFLAESLTEYLARPIINAFHATPPGEEPTTPDWIRYVAALTGIGLAAAYRADVLALFGLVAWAPWIGYVITGVIIGRGSNYLHDLVTRWLAPPDPVIPAKAGTPTP